MNLSYDSERNCHVITVSCHGRQETTLLSDETMADALKVDPGFAFKPDEITPEAVGGLLERLIK